MLATEVVKSLPRTRFRKKFGSPPSSPGNLEDKNDCFCGLISAVGFTGSPAVH